MNVVLPLSFVVLSLRLIHYEHNSVIDSSEVALLHPRSIEFEPCLTDVGLAETSASLC